MCRSWVGGPFFAFTAKAEGIIIEGPVKSFASSEWAERAFCTECGSALWYRLTLEGLASDEYHFAAGLFAEASQMNFDHEVYIDRKPENYTFLHAEHRNQLTEADILEMVGAETNEGST
jgi:hypothetical protein